VRAAGVFGKAHVTGDLTEQNRRDVPVPMGSNRRGSAVGMAILPVGSSLAGLPNAQPLKQTDHFARLEDRCPAHV
jgi:hypothetical protein